jgi:hypothetical protein
MGKNAAAAMAEGRCRNDFRKESFRGTFLFIVQNSGKIGANRFRRGENEEPQLQPNLFFKIDLKMTMDFARGFIDRESESISVNGVLQRTPEN